MFYQACALSLCTLLLILSSIRKLSLFSPSVITCVIWFIVFAAGIVFREDFFPITEEAFVAWLIWFLIFGFISFLFTPRIIQPTEEKYIRVFPIDYAYILIGLIVWLCYRIWVIGTNGPEHFFLNLRLSSNGLEGFEPLGVIGRFCPLVFALFVFEHIYSNKHNFNLRILCWIWMLAYAIATMGKFSLLTPFLAWSVIKGIQGKISSTRVIIFSCIIFILMLVIHFIRAGEQDETGLLDVLATYIYSPIVALGYLQPISLDQPAPFVMRFIYALGNFFGLNAAPVNVILDYVYVPSPTNVYTVMHPFFHDFSLIGVFLEALFYLFLFGFLFRISLLKQGYYLGLYAMFSVCLVGQFIGELFLMLLSQHIQEAISLAFVFFVSRRKFDVS